MKTLTKTSDALRKEVRTLGELLGQVLAELDGPDKLASEERIRKLAKARRAGDEEAEQALIEAIQQLNTEDAFTICRAFTIFFDLANLAEDRHRVRVLREREREGGDKPRSESIRQVVLSLAESGKTADEIRELLAGLTIEPVFTAHPTEAKRRAVRGKLRTIREILAELDLPDRLPREKERARQALLAEMRSLWETDLLRPRKPKVLEEVARGLYFLRTLWEVVPYLYHDLEGALSEAYPGQTFELPTFLTFGSWMGGDRDGNPFVTSLVTLKSLELLRREALRMHLGACRALLHDLTQSSVRVSFSPELVEALEKAEARYPALEERMELVSSEEVYRRWLKMVEWRLEQAIDRSPGGYQRVARLQQDLDLLRSSILSHRPGGHLEMALRDWLIQLNVFGLHFARLDLRQHSGVYLAMATEILARCGLCKDFSQLSEEDKIQLLNSVLEEKLEIPQSGWSDQTREGLATLGVVERWAQEFGQEVLGAHVVSMTHHVSDMLTLLWLQRVAGPALAQPLVPLLETIDDLQRGPEILEAFLSNPHYARYLEKQGNVQYVMVGYSDSTKDGGYLAANWWLFQSQERLSEVAAKHGVKMILFHGRGGALGRGGGPAARSILSLPPEVARAGLRVTEQGEVLSERYDDPQVAYRHLEQLTWAMIRVRSEATQRPKAHWVEAANRMAQNSLEVYRELLEQPDFVAYFRRATPVEGIEQLQLGSRPARRKGEPSLESLRAIPWVFAWTQSRVILPAWYGLGSAFAQESDELLRELYQNWRFFQATVNNAVLAMAKADMDIGRHYAARADLPVIWERIEKEYAVSREALLRVTGCDELLADIPWLQRSIQIRNPYVDPLNFVQLEAFRRWEDGQPEAVALTRLTIQGVASGLRTTG